MELIDGMDAIQIIQLESEDGEILDAIRVMDLELDGNKYSLLQILDCDGCPGDCDCCSSEEEAEEADVYLIFKVVSSEDGDDILEGLEEGEEFEKVSEAFNAIITAEQEDTDSDDAE